MRIVIKVGTSTLAHQGGRLNIRHVEELVKVWSDIENAGHELIIVSSGATGLGVGKLQINKPEDIVTKQAAAAVGQCELMYTYDRLFSMYNHTVAQMLLTWEDFDDESRLHNLSNTLEYLKKGGRISAVAYAAGSLLGIKPVISIEDGQIITVGKARGSRSGNNMLVSQIDKYGGIDFSRPFALGYSGLSSAKLDKYIKDSSALYEGKTENLPITQIGPTIGTYAGEDAIALAWFDNQK